MMNQLWILLKIMNHILLIADNNGLKYYKEILKDANKYLKEKSLNN